MYYYFRLSWEVCDGLCNHNAQYTLYSQHMVHVLIWSIFRYFWEARELCLIAVIILMLLLIPFINIHTT